MATRKTVTKEVQARRFVVMNSDLLYFSGMRDGGKFIWQGDYDKAKPLDDLAKLEALKKYGYEKELLIEYIDEK